MSPRRKRSTVKARILKLAPPPPPGAVRVERVAEARRRIASGWYDRADVRDTLVEAVLHEIRGY